MALIIHETLHLYHAPESFFSGKVLFISKFPSPLNYL